MPHRITPNLLSQVAQHTANATVITDREGRTLWVNDSFERLTGYTRADMLGQFPGKILQGPGTDPATRARMHASLAAGTGFQVEILNYAKDGRAFWVAIDCQPFYDEEGNLHGFVAVQTDVTLRREAEERWKFALESARDGVWDWDITRGRVFYSHGWKAMLGYADDEIGDSMDEFASRVHPDDLAANQPSLLRHLRGETLAHDVELRMRHKDGSWRWIFSRGRVIARDAEGRALRMMGIHRDTSELKFAQAALVQSREQLSLALRAAGMGIFRRDLRSLTGEWDATTLQLFGFPPGSPAPSPDEVMARIHPEDRDLYRTAFSPGEERAFQHIIRVVPPDQPLRYLECDGLIQTDADGQPAWLIGVARDVSDRQLQEHALRTQTERLSLALHGNAYGVWEFDFATGRLLWDEQMHIIYAVPPGGFRETIEDWQRHIHPDDRARVDASFREVLAKPAPIFGVRFRIVHPDGSLRFIDGNGILQRDPAGQPLRAVGLNRDITEAHLADIERRHLDDRLRLAMTSSRMVWWEWDLRTDSCVVSSGDSLCILGYGPGELRTQTYSSWMEKTHPDDRDAVRRSLDETVAGRSAQWICEHRLRDAIGAYRWVREYGRVTERAPDGRPLLVTGTTQDIHEQRQLEEERRAAELRQQRLERQLTQEQKLKTLGTLAGGIAHDFNNLLTGISGFIELAENSAAKPAEVRALLGQARKGAVSARDLIRRILLFSREVPGQPHRPLSLVELVSEWEPLITASLPATIRLSLELAPGPCDVVGDPAQLQQVLMNLCINATHAIGEETGQITVGVGPGKDGDVALSVRDSGCGMDAATLQRIYDPFFTTKEPGKGTGLGLAIVHSIVSAHGGSIEVESQPGQGTCFRIHLPLHHGETGAAGVGASAPEARGQGERLLIVDDDPMVAQFSALALESRGYQVGMHAQAVSGWQAFQDSPQDYDLLLVDLAMPDLSGVDFATSARLLRPDLPILLMSGDHSRFDTRRLMELGHVSLIEKPFSITTLSAAVQQALTGRAASE